MLRVEVVVNHSDDDLKMTLWLHEATHNTETGVKFF